MPRKSRIRYDESPWKEYIEWCVRTRGITVCTAVGYAATAGRIVAEVDPLTPENLERWLCHISVRSHATYRAQWDSFVAWAATGNTEIPRIPGGADRRIEILDTVAKNKPPEAVIHAIDVLLLQQTPKDLASWTWRAKEPGKMWHVNTPNGMSGMPPVFADPIIQWGYGEAGPMPGAPFLPAYPGAVTAMSAASIKRLATGGAQ